MISKRPDRNETAISDTGRSQILLLHKNSFSHNDAANIATTFSEQLGNAAKGLLHSTPCAKQKRW